ncbi:hypothetical protein Tco_1437454 [Tanacetum coccineum]
MEKKDTLSSCSDSEKQQMQLIQDKSKESCMVSFQRLHSHLKCLLNNDLKGSRTEDGFKRAFATLFGQDLETFTGTMFLYMDQLQKQLDNEEFQEIGSMSAFKVLQTQFQMFIKSRFYLDDEYVDMTRNKFLQYTRLDIQIPQQRIKTDTSNALDALDVVQLSLKAMGHNQKSRIQAADQGMMHMYSLKYRYIVLSYRGRTQSLVAKKKDISENRASRNFDLMITNDAPFLNVQMTFEHSSSSLGRQCQMASAENNTSGPAPFLNVQMMSDHNSSDLAPQRQEMSVENVASGLVPQGQKASDYDNSDPVPPRQNVVPSAEKTDSSQQGLEFLFSPLLEEYYNPTHGLAEENNNDQAPNASFQEAEFINPFCTRVQEIGESSSRNIDNTDVHSFQPQSHDYRWTRDHPLEQVHGNPTMPVQTRRQLAIDPEMCMFALTVSIVEPKNIKEAMADSAWIEAMQDELHRFLKVMLDMFTKALPEDRFKYLVRRIGMRCLTPAELEALEEFKKKSMLIADIENDIMDSDAMHNPSQPFGFSSQQKLVSFVTEIHKLSMTSPHEIVDIERWAICSSLR